MRVSSGLLFVDVDAERPLLWDELSAHAALQQTWALEDADASLFLSLGLEGETLGRIAVELRYTPSTAGFRPGLLLIDEQEVVLVGAGRQLLGYRLTDSSLVFADTLACGFLAWTRHDDTVLMSGELTFSAYDLEGRRRWTTFVEPPWHFEVEGDAGIVDVMGSRTRFSLHDGPQRPPS